MNRWAQVLVAVVGGGFLGQFLSMLLGLVMWGVAALFFGRDFDPWQSEIASDIMFFAIFLGSWAVCSWAIWQLLNRRRDP